MTYAFGYRFDACVFICKGFDEEQNAFGVGVRSDYLPALPVCLLAPELARLLSLGKVAMRGGAGSGGRCIKAALGDSSRPGFKTGPQPIFRLDLTKNTKAILGVDVIGIFADSSSMVSFKTRCHFPLLTIS
jgi:hypothetical protein